MGELCKTEEQIETLFGRLTHVGSGKLVLDGGSNGKGRFNFMGVSSAIKSG